eukprot:6205725-Pleurochrysis_carterae.AAC.1
MPPPGRAQLILTENGLFRNNAEARQGNAIKVPNASRSAAALLAGHRAILCQFTPARSCVLAHALLHRRTHGRTRRREQQRK